MYQDDANLQSPGELVSALQTAFDMGRRFTYQVNLLLDSLFYKKTSAFQCYRRNSIQSVNWKTDKITGILKKNIKIMQIGG